MRVLVLALSGGFFVSACSYVPGHPSGDVDAQLTCQSENVESFTIAPALSGLATCAYEEGDGLFVEVGSNECSSLRLQLVDFAGAGRYTVDPNDPDGSWMTIVLYEPATGCDPLGVTAARQLNDICEIPPACEVIVEEGVTPTQPGDLVMTVTCPELVWFDQQTCGTCTASAPIRIEIDDCDLETYRNGGTLQPPN